MAISAADLLAKAEQGLPFAQARAQIVATAPQPRHAPPLLLAKAAGRTLFSPLVAQRDTPAAAVSAMDGYALRQADLTALPACLTIEGQTPAGAAAGQALGRNCARRIFTGAPLPPGADTVVAQENAVPRGDQVIVHDRPTHGAFVRPQAFDFAAGDPLLPAGQRLDARALALAAAANLDRVVTAQPPRVGVLSTGDELRAPGQVSAAHQVVASNGLTLTALLNDEGAQGHDLGFVGDDLKALETALAEGVAAHDLVITTGGASVGDFDLVQQALANLGGKPVFWRVMMRPGKPVFLWHLGETWVLGLPGNPVSAYVCARVLALPWVRSALGRLAVYEPTEPFTLSADLPKNGPRHQFARAQVHQGQVVPAPSQDSSLITTLQRAHVLIERPPFDPPKTKGEQIQAIRL